MQLADIAGGEIDLASPASFDYHPAWLCAENSEILRFLSTMDRNKNYLQIVTALLLLAAGCHRHLAETPYLLQHQDPQQVYAACARDCQSPEAPILYATDRTNSAKGNLPPDYGYERAMKLAFGIANVTLSPHATWQELIQDSTRLKRNQEYELKLAGIREEGHLQPQRAHQQAAGQASPIAQAAARKEDPGFDQFQGLLHQRLEQTPKKDVYIFVHGFNNSFEDGVLRAAEVWHFMGRSGVPIAYTWPAGRGGLRGYAYDRESGEFSVSHLREFIRTVAACPGVERVHLIAHSRGADVTVSALRELNLGYVAQGKSTQAELKLENLVLAAPDIDEDVFMQRFVAEKLLQAARRTTIYASKYDRAIEAADWLFASRQRLGALAIRDVSPKIRQALAKLPNVQFIECKISSMWMLNHDYVFSNPAAMSDLILVLRDRHPPGAENGRPLQQPTEGIWELTEDYLKEKGSSP